MVDRHAWHYVKPIENPIYSIMISGFPWDGVEASKNISASFASLDTKTFDQLFRSFTTLI